MDTKQFIASLASSLAWPLAVTCVAVLFRAQISGLLKGRLSHIKAGPFEADFEQLRSEVQAELRQTADAPRALQADTRKLGELAQRAPAAAIVEAHTRMVHELRHALTAAGHQPFLDADARELAHSAFEHGLITTETVNAVEGITVMRNLAVHGPPREITDRHAEEYVTLVDGVLYAIRQNVRRSERSMSNPE